VKVKVEGGSRGTRGLSSAIFFDLTASDAGVGRDKRRLGTAHEILRLRPRLPRLPATSHRSLLITRPSPGRYSQSTPAEKWDTFLTSGWYGSRMVAD
jgi:hypothetical protein